ncbi:MAG: hypothetical protein R8M45_04320 [Ghiorsea sp.]
MDKEVDYIFNKYYKEYFLKLQKVDTSHNAPYPVFAELKSTELAKHTKNPVLIKANETNPIKIELNNKLGNFYNYKKELVSININSQIHKFIDYHLYTNVPKGSTVLDLVSKQKGAGNKTQWIQDVKGEKLKNSIAHELAHWLQDTLHNRHLSKIMKRATNADNRNTGEQIRNQFHKSVALTDYEVDSHIHQIKQLKRNISDDVWATMSIMDMINQDSSLAGIYDSLIRKEKKEWLKHLAKRLNREGLMGNGKIQ